MATAIRQIELSRPIEPIDLTGSAERAMLVLRWRGRIVGRAFVAVQGGRLSTAEIQAAAADHLTSDALRAWVEDALAFDERRRDRPAPTATVAICTRERPDDLARTLDAVRRLRPAPTEILVVDNAPSSGATRAVTAGYPSVRYVVEPIRGLNTARNRALREARGEVVAFTDDDAMPEVDWLEGLLVNFSDPRVVCVNGLTLPLELETPAQELFEEHCSFARGFARQVFNGRFDNPLLVARAGAGANMAVRRSLPDIVGWFDERLDAGTPTQSGGDHQMFTRILAAGYRIVYEPHAVSWHRHRRTFEELLTVVRGYGTGVYAMWTGLLLEQHDLAVLRSAWRWFRYDHLPLLRDPSRLRAQSGRDALRRAELRGCLSGPRAWFASRRMRRLSA
jgi:glycosyltransferase involved in cell wall biosynthesis